MSQCGTTRDGNSIASGGGKSTTATIIGAARSGTPSCPATKSVGNRSQHGEEQGSIGGVFFSGDCDGDWVGASRPLQQQHDFVAGSFSEAANVGIAANAEQHHPGGRARKRLIARAINRDGSVEQRINMTASRYPFYTDRSSEVRWQRRKFANRNLS